MIRQTVLAQLTSYRMPYLLAAALCCLAGCSGSASSGDRVLVNKCLYDTGLLAPKRYDVVVFKYPGKPVENNIPKNYIKRLLGLPGEVIAIFFGRLFKINETDLPPISDEERKRLEERSDTPREIVRERAKAAFEAGLFEPLRKPPDVQLALRRIVNDHDYQPIDVPVSRWTPSAQSKWKSNDKNGFVFEGQTEATDWLRYQHLVRPSDGPADRNLKPRLITDVMGYNSFKLEHVDRINGEWRQMKNVVGVNWVGDLMLEAKVTVGEPQGEFCVEVSKGIYRYQASFDLASGKCSLYRLDRKGDRTELASQPTSMKSTGTYHVRLSNFDSRLTVWVNGDLPFGHGFDYQPPELVVKGESIDAATLIARRGPTENDLEPASFGAKNARVSLQHVQLWRDTYYSCQANNPADYGHEDRMPAEAWSDSTKWAPLRELQYNVLPVDQGHYLCLGDNSPASSDGRDWGLVPERLMLGRALLVYWPFHRAGPIR